MGNNIGQNIANKRKELGWTQEDLAKRMGYKSKSTINKIELGVNDIPQSKVVKFADALGVSVAYLMGWEEVKKNNDILTDIVVRMRTDEDFASILKGLNQLDSVQLASVKQVVDAFLSRKV